MQATLYVVGRSDDHVIKKSQSPSRKKKKKRLHSCFQVGLWEIYLLTFLPFPKIPVCVAMNCLVEEG